MSTPDTGILSIPSSHVWMVVFLTPLIAQPEEGEKRIFKPMDTEIRYKGLCISWPLFNLFIYIKHKSNSYLVFHVLLQTNQCCSNQVPEFGDWTRVFDSPQPWQIPKLWHLTLASFETKATGSSRHGFIGCQGHLGQTKTRTKVEVLIP